MDAIERHQARDGEHLWNGRRQDRFFRDTDGWFFKTREQTVLGPFASRYEAQQELLMYLREQRLRRSRAEEGQPAAFWRRV